MAAKIFVVAGARPNFMKVCSPGVATEALP